MLDSVCRDRTTQSLSLLLSTEPALTASRLYLDTVHSLRFLFYPIKIIRAWVLGLYIEAQDPDWSSTYSQSTAVFYEPSLGLKTSP